MIKFSGQKQVTVKGMSTHQQMSGRKTACQGNAMWCPTEEFRAGRKRKKRTSIKGFVNGLHVLYINEGYFLQIIDFLKWSFITGNIFLLLMKEYDNDNILMQRLTGF